MASVTTVSQFPSAPGGGSEPDGLLFMASNGDLLGATVDGGGATDIGTTYEVVKTGAGFATTPTFLADIPIGVSQLVGVPNLSADASGDLFAGTLTGGGNNFGTIVEFPAAGGAPITLATFAGGASGSQPGGKLLVDASGNLFGTTASGGASGTGTVFELQKTGGVYATTPTRLTSFTSGLAPAGSGNLVADAQGDLFGASSHSVFEVKKTGSSYAAPVDLIPGRFPVGTQIGDLTMDAEGDIFGTTAASGANQGTVFEIKKISTGYASAATTLATFTAAAGLGQLSANHLKALIVDANGDLFGTTDPSAQNSGGVVYELAETPVGYVLTTVVSFAGTATHGLGANLVADANGDLFATTQTGGANATSGAVVKITGSGYATTPTPPAATANILWQNTSGQAAIWNMFGNILIGGGPVTPTPGPSFRAVGTGDFNKDGKSDILWQNTSTGQASVWEMNGSTLLGGGPVTPNPGLVFHAVGTGDFNGDGFSDILWQNTSTGQASIWEMNGNTLIGGGTVTPNPGPSFRAVGTGDFNHDGFSDILWQNQDTGQISVWEMHGNTLIGGGPVTPNPGTAWQAIGTGDFNKDGFADILLQNKDTGAISVWEMNGSSLIGGGVVANPGLSWHAIGAGGTGGSDILLQNTSGQATIWEMNGNTIAGGGPVSPNPGSTWHAIALT